MFNEHPMVFEDALFSSLSTFRKMLGSWEKENEIEIKATEENLNNANELGTVYPDGYDPTDPLIDLYHGEKHDGALRTLALVGVFAPTIEGLLNQQFKSLKKTYEDPDSDSKNLVKKSNNRRWYLYPHNKDQFWSVNNHVIKDKDTGIHIPETNFIKGFAQIRKALSIDSFYEPEDIECIEALFAFRNKSLHNGYYWPLSERNKFKNAINQNHWEDYFTWSTEGDELGICYISDLMEHKLFDTCLGINDSFIKILGLENEPLFQLKRRK